MSELSFTEVGEILGLIEKLDCDTFELEHGDFKISVRRAGAPVSPPAVPPQAAPDAKPAAPIAATGQETPEHWVAIPAPMVGTFYRRRAPEEPPLIEVGDRVEAGQPVGLIEVMKLFTELRAEESGTVVRIDAEDAALVEYGAALVWVETGTRS